MPTTFDDPSPLLPGVAEPGPEKEALRFADRSVSYADLQRDASVVADEVDGAGRVAVWATSTYETCVAVVGALLAGVPIVPINPNAGERDLEHVLADSKPEMLLADPAAAGFLVDHPVAGRGRPVVSINLGKNGGGRRNEPAADQPGLILYTSGTTGPPKGVVIPRRAIASNLDGIAQAWDWTQRDVLVHALPLFHAHGLIMGILGPLRVGGSIIHLGRFSARTVADTLASEGTMLFGVPTMYHRLANESEVDPEIAAGLGKARLLVSGSAALSPLDADRIRRQSGKDVIQRYGMTETLMIAAMQAGAPAKVGTVGPPVPGVEVEVRPDPQDGAPPAVDDRSGEVFVRGASLFSEYLNQPGATDEAFDEAGWFRTGDVGFFDDSGSLHLMGRSSADIIKTGGFKVGAGEVEDALQGHLGVRESAVTGIEDADLGQVIVAWVVPADNADPPDPDDLIAHVSATLTSYKRPRKIVFVPELPRNDLGKVLKHKLLLP